MGRYVAWPPPEEFRDLLHRAQQGDSRARDNLLTALRPPLLAFFSYRLRQDVAEDLTQVALIRITRSIPRIDPGRADRFVTTVARNLLRSAYRRRATAPERVAGDSWIDRAASREALDLDLEYRELAEAVERASATALPKPLARIVLGLLHGKTSAELAAEQGVSPITIRTRLARARATLRRELRAFLGPQDAGRQVRTQRNTRERIRKCRCMWDIMSDDRLSEMLARYLGPSVLPAFADEDVTEVYLNPQDSAVRIDTRSRGKVETGVILPEHRVEMLLNAVASGTAPGAQGLFAVRRVGAR